MIAVLLLIGAFLLLSAREARAKQQQNQVVFSSNGQFISRVETGVPISVQALNLPADAISVGGVMIRDLVGDAAIGEGAVGGGAVGGNVSGGSAPAGPPGGFEPPEEPILLV